MNVSTALKRVNFGLALTFLACFTGLSFAAPVAPANEKVTVSSSVTPNSAEYFVQAAREEMKNNQYKNVEKYLKKAKKLNPDLPEIYQLLGDYHMAFSRAHKAEKFYAKAKELKSAKD